MLSWSEQRKLVYLLGTLAVLFVLIYIPFLLFWYKTPTCFDSIKNGDETGVDCGGSCSQICVDTAVPPIVLWSRAFQVVPGIYSAVAYIENPNPNFEAVYAEYLFTFYDEVGRELLIREGTTFIPQGQRFAVFEGVINFGTTTPARVTFSFTNIPQWREVVGAQKNALVVRNSTLLREDTAPRIEATVFNQSQRIIDQAELVAIVYDAQGRSVASSRTVVDSIRPGATERVTFSWPQKFETSVSVCQSPVDVALVIDRSGSMKKDGTDPPEPLTSTKMAAELFIDQLAEEDRVSVVSFATDTTVHTTGLTSNKLVAKEAVRSIEIIEETGWYTDIAQGLQIGADTISRTQAPQGTRRAIVLLTDGMPTSPDSDTDILIRSTQEIARRIQDAGFTIYAIGLGTAVDRSFLESIVTLPVSYRGAVQRNDLKDIYRSLATEICARRPAVIEIIPRILPENRL